MVFFTEFDEDELEAELNELEMEGDMEEQEKLEAELLDVGVADQLPETPREEPAAAVAKPAQGNLLRGYWQLFGFGSICGTSLLKGPGQQFQ